MPAEREADVTSDLPGGAPPVSRSSPGVAGRLDAGATLASRYRIVSQLGKGGMGEVYRADDLELSTPVALKFLPPSLAADPVRLDHLRAEVRVARQVSHANVCRVFDIAQSEGRSFITMEYVDGEDLSTLLRRIGRLPTEKAVELARQICLGLAAAHEQRIVHRDLKPANIMVDGRGHARIMDFGIAAALSDDTPDHTGIAGTPAYMAPEQADGEPPTVRSDIYSLGLVLYEVFTGKPGVKATTLADAREFHRTSDPANPSTHVGDLDPAVDRTIMRCLERDPARRPHSAIAVLTSLPGADPLAAAIAAGETPSPELVAASGGEGLISIRNALALAALAAGLLAAVVLLYAPSNILGRLPPAKGREVLADRAREIIAQLAPDNPVDFSVTGMLVDRAFIHDATRAAGTPERWSLLAQRRAGPFALWCRQSPAPLEPVGIERTITPLSPFPAVVGESLVQVDEVGRLEFFVTVPARTPPTPADAANEPDWSRLFQLSGYDPSLFSPAEPERRPVVNSDLLRAWVGADPAHPDIPVRITAAAALGRPVYWRVTYPWDPPMVGVQPAAPATRWADVLNTIVLIAVTAAGLWLCIRHLKLGRGDRDTALRAAAVVFVLRLLVYALNADSLPDVGSALFQGEGVGLALWNAATFWAFYIAVEPYARRRLPHTLVSWARLFLGRLTDPLVGRDVLIGAAAGAVGSLITATTEAVFMMAGGAALNSPTLGGGTTVHLQGPAAVVGHTLECSLNSLMWGTGSLLCFVLGHMIFNRPARAAAFLLAVTALVQLSNVSQRPEHAVGYTLAMIPIAFVFATRGLLAGIIAFLVIYFAPMLPVGLHWTAPYAVTVFIPTTILATLISYGVFTSAGLRTTPRHATA